MSQTKKVTPLLILVSTVILNSARLRAKEPVDYVDPLLGTSDSRWLLSPGPTMPFGMVKLSPDNQGDVPGRVKWKAGYEYTVENITGFSHIHSWTMGGLLCMPTVGKLQTRPGLESDPDQGYRSRYRHDTEEAAAGYYAVTLDDYQVRAELTATTRTGVHRYTFPASEHARILLDLEFPTEYGFKVLDGQPLNRPWFYHSDLVDGGKLVLRMGREPNENWGSSVENAPPSTF